MEGRTELQGQKAIAGYFNRPWNTVKDLIDNKNFPAVRINGRWESDTKLIDEWRRNFIGQAVGQA